MSPIFKRIRQKLADENQFLKYSRYAIGEIVLVAIGITLAFQVNQWKDDKEEQELEIKLLTEIQNGLKSDLVDVKVNHKWQSDILKSQYKVIDWLQSDVEANDSITYHFSMAIKRTSFMISTAPFESLKEFGLNRVSNDSITQKIITLYDVLYPKYENVISMYYEQGDNLFDVGYLYFDDWDLSPYVYSNKPKNILQLKADHTVFMRLKYLTDFNLHLVSLNSRMEELLIEAIDLIELELND